MARNLVQVLCRLSCRLNQPVSWWFVFPIDGVPDSFRKLRTVSSVAIEKSGLRSGFAVKFSWQKSVNNFFSCCVTAYLLFSFKGGILPLSSVKRLVTLHVPCILPVSRLRSVWSQLLQSRFLIAVSIGTLTAFIRGRKAMLCVLCHSVRSFSCSWFNRHDAGAICMGLKILVLRAADFWAAVRNVSVRWEPAISIYFVLGLRGGSFLFNSLCTELRKYSQFVSL
jgi:hypothetical protein